MDSYLDCHPLPRICPNLVVFAVNVFGDALRDVLYPKLRGR